DSGQPYQLLEAQPFIGFEEAVLIVVALARHAVGAAEVAAVDHRQPQVAQRPPHTVLEPLTANEQSLDFLRLGCHSPHHRYSRATYPRAKSAGPGGSSTNPSVSASAARSPEPLVGEGVAHGRPHSSRPT